MASLESDIKIVDGIYAISDIHVDYRENMQFIENLSASFSNAALILAGDVTHNMSLLEKTLVSLRDKFAVVMFVPGNHDLWIEKGDGFKDSLKKFYAILSLCKQLDVYTEPVKLLVRSSNAPVAPVWLVPLFAWYAKPEDDAFESLYYRPTSGKLEDVEHMETIWSDNTRCKWPTMTDTLASYFASLNAEVLAQAYMYDAPIITYSHFVPRQDLVIPSEADIEEVNKERLRMGINVPIKYAEPPLQKFNISRFAGAKIIDRQLRQIGSILHVFGHQHSNRDRIIENVRYISHCLGYPREGKSGFTWGVHEWNGPKLIWPQS